MRGPGFDQRSAGFTSIEVVIATMLGGLLLLGVYSVLDSATDSTTTDMIAADLERSALKALAQVAEEMSLSGEAAIFPRLAPPLSAAGVFCQRATGYSGGAVQWGPTRLIAFDYDVDDPNDGLDNDGDGRIDEGILVLRINPGAPGEHRVLLARHVAEFLAGEIENGLDDNGNGLVDERGFAITTQSGIHTIRLTLERGTPAGHVISRTFETSVYPRN